MSVNSSSSSTGALVYHCSESKLATIITSGVSVVKTLLLALSTSVLVLGYQRWRRQRSFQSASHSDLFTYHLAAMETSWGPGLLLFLTGTYWDDTALVKVGFCFYSLSFYGQIFFHILTCVERYLAVVHPVTYVGLRGARGAGIRNICIGGVWLLCLGMMGLHVVLNQNHLIILVLCSLVFCITIISFCSISVLSVLIRRGPGEGGGAKKRVDQLKHRAFVTVAAISSVLWLWFVGLLVATAVSNSSPLSEDVKCVVMASVGWLNVPTSLVSPLLYLHRAGKLPRCCNIP